MEVARSSHWQILSLLHLLLLTSQCGCSSQPNVLMIIVDDMTTEALSTYPEADEVVYTPNMAALAARSVQFNQAHAQQALCGPSRTSFMTSRYPDQTKVHDLDEYWRDNADYTSMPQYFKVRMVSN